MSSQAIDKPKNCLCNLWKGLEKEWRGFSTRWAALLAAFDCEEAVLVPMSCFYNWFVSYIFQRIL